jgi:DNA-binding transcriptional LysR family regulator
VELVLQDLRLDLLADEFDVALRVGALPDSGLIAQALPPLGLIPRASSANLQAHGHPSTPAELQSQNCLDFTYAGEPLLWRFNAPEVRARSRSAGPYASTTGRPFALRLRSIWGVILQPEIVIADDIAAGWRIRVLADHAGRSLPLHRLTLPDRRPSLKLRRFIELFPKCSRQPVQLGEFLNLGRRSHSHIACRVSSMDDGANDPLFQTEKLASAMALARPWSRHSARSPLYSEIDRETSKGHFTHSDSR